MIDILKATVPMLLSLATFAANVPVIFVTFRSRRFESDSVAKMISSLALSGIGSGVFVDAFYAGVALAMKPTEQPPEWLLRFVNSAVYTFGVSCALFSYSIIEYSQFYPGSMHNRHFLFENS